MTTVSTGHPTLPGVLGIYVRSNPPTLTSLIWIPLVTTLAGQLSGPIIGSQIEILKFIDICSLSVF